MQITLINTITDKQFSEFQLAVKELSDRLIASSQLVNSYNLDELKINFCTGCWNCWWKTPGKCMFSDDAELIYSDYLASDLVVLATPIIAGFPSFYLKNLQDRLIPLIHPYIQLIQGECHHHKRYEHYPDIGLLVYPEHTTDEEDLKIIEDSFKRFALNLHGSLKFMFTMPFKTEEVMYAVDHI